MATELSRQDRLDFHYHDGIVERNAAASKAFLESLLTIRDRELWRAGRFKGFKDYLDKRSPWSIGHTRRLLADEKKGHFPAEDLGEDRAPARAHDEDPTEKNVEGKTPRGGNTTNSAANASPETRKSEVVAVLDGDGEPVTDEELHPIFTEAAAFDEALNAIGRIKGRLAELADGPAGSIMAEQRQEAERARKNLYELVKFARPWAVCPYCKAGKSQCKACQGRRWVNKVTFEQAPA